MAKRFVMLLIAVSLVVGTAGITAASEHDFETRGVHDYAGRGLGYLFYPVGWVLDTFIAKPVGFIACVAPNVTGCTSHDRRSLGMDRVDIDVPEEGD